VTLSDGQEYSADRLDNDPMALMIALMVSWRANEESKTKGRRVAAAWAEKRRKVTAGEAVKLTSKAPAWLYWNPEGWAIDPAKGEIVRRVFSLTLAGYGEHRIAQTFNQERVPVMGRGKMWHRSAIAKLLRNPATIGTLTPGRIEYVGDKRSRVMEAPIPEAYPAVIDMADWLTVRALKDGDSIAVRGRGAKAPLANVLSGLARCPDCGAAMTRVHKGNTAKGGKPKLVCTRAKAGAEKHYHSVPLEPVEEAVLRAWPKLIADVPAGSLHTELDQNQRSAEGTLSALEDHLVDLMEAIERQPSSSLAASIRRVEQEARTMRELLHDIEEQRANADGGVIHMRLDSLADALGEGQEETEVILERVNAALRVLFSGVVVNHHRGTLDFHWKQGGTTSVMYAWID